MPQQSFDAHLWPVTELHRKLLMFMHMRACMCACMLMHTRVGAHGYTCAHGSAANEAHTCSYMRSVHTLHVHSCERAPTPMHMRMQRLVCRASHVKAYVEAYCAGTFSRLM
mmetsp:Transcript_62368/g.123273  ORF Transcript_62368/g.123273 Transcript_62368/m.123273 type:complete len:111 (-) Transcript_62368:152-484(-)